MFPVGRPPGSYSVRNHLHTTFGQVQALPEQKKLATRGKHTGGFKRSFDGVEVD